MKLTVNPHLCSTLFGALLSVVTLQGFAGQTLDRIKHTGVINIGFREAGLPFSYKNSDQGAPLGYSIDVCNALVEAIKQESRNKNAEVKYVAVAGSARIQSIIEGKIDIECANSTNTKARRDQVAFSMPYYFAAAKLLVRQNSGIGKLEDMDGKTMAVLKGTTGAMIAESARKTRGLAAMKIMVVDSSADGASAVEKGSADAFMQDDILLHGFKAQAKEPLTVVGSGLSVEPLAVMFAKNDPELAAIMEREMAHMYTSGKMKQIYKKWFQSPLPQRGFNLNVPSNPLLADMFSRPSSFVVDWTIL
jgi:glutamate/aspartate transport system substrate-binding protein